MSLFNWGDFTLHSGKQSNFLIDCDTLTDEDLEALAALANYKNFLGSFGKVYGIPNGGLRFAKFMEKYIDKESNWTLIVDDVMTTGDSMREAYDKFQPTAYGLVIFTRTAIYPWWVTPIFEVL